MTVDRFIASSKSWDEFYRRMRSLPEGDKGRVFERFVQIYLETEPEYRAKLRDVWLRSKVPPDVRKTIKFPHRDEGVDLIARTYDGEFWSIQAKAYYQDGAIGRAKLGFFYGRCAIACARSMPRRMKAYEIVACLNLEGSVRSLGTTAPEPGP